MLDDCTGNTCKIGPYPSGILKELYGIQRILESQRSQIAAKYARQLHEWREQLPAFWFTQYVAFCSVVVLYLYTIQRKSDPPQTWIKYLEAAKKCQEQISSAANENSLAQRYGVILQELKAEVDRQTKQARIAADISTTSRDDGVEGGEDSNDMQRFFEEVEQQSITPNSQMMEMTGWDEFDSLIMNFGIGLPTDTHGNTDITMLI